MRFRYLELFDLCQGDHQVLHSTCGIGCNVTGGDSLWDRVLVHQVVIVQTLCGGGPGIMLRGSKICSTSVRDLDIETCDVDSCDQGYWC